MPGIQQQHNRQRQSLVKEDTLCSRARHVLQVSHTRTEKPQISGLIRQCLIYKNTFYDT